jgi:hypothetical protein
MPPPKLDQSKGAAKASRPPVVAAADPAHPANRSSARPAAPVGSLVITGQPAQHLVEAARGAGAASTARLPLVTGGCEVAS